MKLCKYARVWTEAFMGINVNSCNSDWAYFLSSVALVDNLQKKKLALVRELIWLNRFN